MTDEKTVLIVEDDPVVNLFTCHVLEDAGFRVACCDNADDALAYLWDKSSEVAAVFTDVRMPGFSDGFHLAELIKRHWPGIEVLVTSGKEIPSAALRRDIHFFAKPWHPDQVIAVVKVAVSANPG